MQYKALFIDVDDTLVLHGMDNLPTERVTNAISRLKKQGIHVGLATSRPLHAVGAIIEHLHLVGLCVISGGTQIYDPLHKKIVHEVLLPKPAIPEVLTVAKESSLKVGYFDGNKDTVLHDFELSSTERVIAMYLPEVDLQCVEEVERTLQKIRNIALHRMLSWNKLYGWIDVTNADATKAHGVQTVAHLLNLKTEEIVGVGDGYNDVPLFDAVGLKVAMGNSVEELKHIADVIAPSVYKDGLADIIETYF